jgi:lambda family phage portal protein
MGFWQRIQHAFAGPLPQPARRSYAAATGGRLTAGWLTAGTSADAEIQGSLPRIRDRARSMDRDTPYVPQIKRLVRDNVVGPHGIQLQMRVMQLRGGQLDERINSSIEQGWRQWGNRDSCDVAGQKSWLDFEWQAVMAGVDSGETIIRFVRQPFGRNNRIPLALEAIESDQLDLNHVGPLKDPRNSWRMGIERDRWGRPQTYAILTAHPGDYLTSGTNAASQRRVEYVPAEDIVHVFFPERLGQTRGVPRLHAVIADAHQANGYEEAATIRARTAASQMGFIRTDDGELIGDGVMDNQRVTDFEPGVFKYLKAGEDVVVPQMQSPDSQFEMFVRQKGRRIAMGTGVSYASLTRDASQASYSSQRQEYLQDQDAWSVEQTMLIQRLHERVFAEWLPLAVLAGAVRLPDFELRPERYLMAAQWQPRGWQWVDPKKEAEANVIMEGAGYVSKTQIIARLGTTYEQILKDKQQEQQLEAQYGVQPQAPPPVRPDPPAEDSPDA